jgi:beta-xylosidase
VVQTAGAISVSGSGATLTASVNPEGSATTYWFQYGTGTTYGAQTAVASAGSGTTAVTVSSSVSGLSPLTQYHYRVVATDCNGCSSGTAYGSDQTLTTGGYKNPVSGSTDTPDPYVLDDAGQHRSYWAFTTGNLFPVLHSTDLVHWTTQGTAMSTLPSWVVQSGDWHPWSPSVIQAPEACPGTASSSCYVMYYVGFSQKWHGNCVAVATSTQPGGPYTDQGPLSDGTPDALGRPLGCGDNQGHGMIDPSPFVDPATGQAYLYASEDYACPPASSSCTSSNSVLRPTISVVPLTSGLLSASGARVPLFSGDPGSWESAGVATPTVEGPTMAFHNGTYYLLYSGGNWRGAYGMGYATAVSPTGPFTKAPQNPILTETVTVFSPGGGDTSVTGPHGGAWTVYHGRQGSVSAPRTLRIDPFSWRSSGSGLDVPVIGGPTDTPQATVP